MKPKKTNTEKYNTPDLYYKTFKLLLKYCIVLYCVSCERSVTLPAFSLRPGIHDLASY